MQDPVCSMLPWHRDAWSTSNLCKHAKVCWGKETIHAADQSKDVHAACGILGNKLKKDSSITTAFERIAKIGSPIIIANIQGLSLGMILYQNV